MEGPEGKEGSRDVSIPSSPVTVQHRHGHGGGGLRVHQINMWEDPAVAARRRSIAGGHETGPPVTVTDTAMINPSTRHSRQSVFPTGHIGIDRGHRPDVV